MRLRQEPIVFLAAVLALGGMGYGLFTGGAATLRGGDRPSASGQRERFVAPDTAVALPNAATPPLARELFSPPRDTSPLPSLELVEPPRERLPLLLPPTDPGPAASAYGKLLRRALPRVDLPDLFVAKEEAETEVEDDAFLELAGRDEKKPALVPDGEKSGSQDPLANLTPAEREVVLTTWKQRYDWIQRGPGELWFGRIVNPDRYGLEADPARASEALLFVHLDPATGREKFANISAPPLPVARADIGGFGFADTIANGLELRARKLATGEFTRSSFDEALVLARECIANRLEAPRALVIAEELFRRAAAYDAKDPLPRIGLARCMEAAFRFEDAFQTYQELLAAFPHREEIHVALALLEERFLMYTQAEARLHAALDMNRGSWISRFGLGGFLVRRGRAGEAVEHLKVASQAAPQEPELLPIRVAIRTTLGDAHLALGDLAEAEAAYRSAVSADAKHERAQAGLLAAQVLAGKAPAEAVTTGEGVGFELLLARGVAALAAGQHEAARDLLRLAVEADPLRAHLALAALSVLAEVTGNAEEALRLADEALERDPISPFALFQKGRLLGLQDDYEGARAALLAALEQELDFEDALVALGDMAFRLGRFEDAERYLERAVAIDPKRAEVHALRGLNLLRLDLVTAARASFERALELQRTEPCASAGMAWCLYLEGDPGEAVIRIADIEEQRRAEPQTDAWRVWSRTQLERLKDHLEKVEWRDPFSRKRLVNGWLTYESDGPTVGMVDGAVEISGVFSKSGMARVYRPYDTGVFVSFEADVYIEPGKMNASIGIFAVREALRRNDNEVIAEASVSRHKEGNVQLRFVRQGQKPDVRDMEQPFPLGQWVRLKLVREGESTEATVTLLMDGIPLIEDLPMPALGQAKSQMIVGLFAEGDTGREVQVRMDNVSIVTRMAP
jgi:tetratricopeptide (TPR) repeat protein